MIVFRNDSDLDMRPSGRASPQKSLATFAWEIFRTSSRYFATSFPPSSTPFVRIPAEHELPMTVEDLLQLVESGASTAIIKIERYQPLSRDEGEPIAGRSLLLATPSTAPSPKG